MDHWFWQIGVAGVRDQLYPVVLREIDIPLEFQEDYGVYALYTCLEIAGRKISSQLMAAALLEWQERYPEGGNSTEFWAKLMDKWVEQRLPFLPEEKRRSVSIQLVREQFTSTDAVKVHEAIWVIFGNGSKRKGAIHELPSRQPNYTTTFKACLSESAEIIAAEEGATGNCTRQTWLLGKSERLARIPSS